MAMDNPIKNVTLAFPCEKKWKDLQGNGKERFCSQCNHAVKDFTHATADELQQERSGCTRVCGKFKVSQLHPAFLKSAAATSLLAASLVSCTPDPQPMLPTIQPPPQNIPVEEDFELMGDVVFLGVIIPDLDSIELDNESDY